MRISLLALVLAATLTAQAPSQTFKAPPLTVLRNMRLIDGSGGPARDHVTLVLSGGRIQQICDEAHLCATPATAVGMDLAGKTVMPGLINAHGHLALLNAESNFDSAQYTERNVLRQLEQYERYGVTTMTSLGLNKDLVYSVRAHQHTGQFDGATLLTAGRGIGVPDGFPPMNGSSDQLYRPTTPEEARHAVDESVANHADLIKIWIDSNHNKFPEMSDAVVHTVISEAHKNHLSVAAHVYALEDARRVVNMGVDILAHSVRDKEVDDSFIKLLKRKHIWYFPTLTVDESFFVFADHPELTQSPFFRDAIPAETLARLNSSEYREKTLSDLSTAVHRQDLAMASRNVKKLYDAGVQIGFGTDSGAMLGRVPGYSEHRELQLLVAAGLAPLQAISTATSHNGLALHLGNKGLVSEGEIADLIIVDGDPSTTISDTTHIVAVFHNGVRLQHVESAQ
ncbi:amidohydrolase family protein [Terriglobus saanensis]|uniref:Amidohydrolase n=1 Tax=Terriglobus saanensis (strain ATCC BAA-1853 / DSM 23119 / SP1PR4) TaxID=401053 RepID=E8V6D9_TERSS|nr:amidohydrolase family protein [Terriglobus saanensis]ADV81604.1 amidohydrolase [Terriglobus saanensis SP1PR4]